MTEITPIHSHTVVKALRDALAKAERGELRSVAIAYETNADSTGHSFALGPKCWVTALLGELEATKLSLLVESGRLHPKEDT